jgi:hypothetical protein
MVDRVRPAGRRLYPLKNKPLVEMAGRLFLQNGGEFNPRSSFVDFALKPLYFSEINLRSVILQLGSKFKKIFSKGPYT